jgi:hypothetical protein
MSRMAILAPTRFTAVAAVKPMPRVPSVMTATFPSTFAVRLMAASAVLDPSGTSSQARAFHHGGQLGQGVVVVAAQTRHHVANQL